jgi:NAD(P)-dependent dehydrogenase (short-subunit alcohol dehydrogenase family)
MPGRLQNKVAVISGGGSGKGLAGAERFVGMDDAVGGPHNCA